MTLYETMIPRTSFSTPSLTLKRKKRLKASFFKILTEHQRLELTDCSHARGGQVGVFMLQFAIQSDAPPLPVVGQQRQHLVDFLQRRSRRHRVPDEKEQISFKGNTQNNQKVKYQQNLMLHFLQNSEKSCWFTLKDQNYKVQWTWRCLTIWWKAQ